MKKRVMLLGVVLLAIATHQAQADTAGLAAARMGVMSSSAPLGATFISSLGSTEATSGSKRMKLAAREDAALYAATNGQEERPALEQAYQAFLAEEGTEKVDKMHFAVDLLAAQ